MTVTWTTEHLACWEYHCSQVVSRHHSCTWISTTTLRPSKDKNQFEKPPVKIWFSFEPFNLHSVHWGFTPLPLRCFIQRHPALRQVRPFSTLAWGAGIVGTRFTNGGWKSLEVTFSRCPCSSVLGPKKQLKRTPQKKVNFCWCKQVCSGNWTIVITLLSSWQKLCCMLATPLNRSKWLRFLVPQNAGANQATWYLTKIKIEAMALWAPGEFWET